MAKKLTKAKRKEYGLPLHLSLSPRGISKNAWYYEERGKLHLVVWVAAPRALSRGESIPVNVRIPWSTIEGSIKRMRAELRSAGKETAP